MKCRAPGDALISCCRKWLLAVCFRERSIPVRQIMSRHEEVMQNLDRTDKLTAGKKGSLESTMKKTMESTKQAWNKNVKFQGL